MLPALVCKQYRPRLERDEDPWYWSYEDPDPKACGQDLKLLTPRDERLLGRSALKLYMELERERGWTDRWFHVRIDLLAEKIGMPLRTARRVLHRLRDCGAVETRRIERPDIGLRPNGLEFWIWGSFDTRNGVRRVLLPIAQFDAWAIGKQRWGGARRGKRYVSSWPVEPRQEGKTVHMKSTTYDSSWPPLREEKIRSGSDSSSSIGMDGDQQGRRLDNLSGEKREEQKPKTIEELLHLFDEAMKVPMKPLVPPDPDKELVLPPLDPIPTRIDGSPPMAPGHPPTYYVSVMVAAYRQAVQSVYGFASKAFIKKGQIEKSKHFSKLADCAEVLVEHEIPPRAWAEWVLAKFKSRGMRFPLKVTSVFSDRFAAKRHGWFWKEYDRGGIVLDKVDRLYSEQLYRRQEAVNLWRGMTVRGVMRSFPPWYFKMREEERAAGHEDSLDFYPRAKKARAR